MKKNIAILAALVAGSMSASAQEDLSLTTTFGWESKYVFRGVQLAEHVFTPSIDLSMGGFYAGLWAALPVDNTASTLAEYDAGLGYLNEVDIYVGYGFSLGEVLSADVGATYYTYPSVSDDFIDNDVNSLEVYAGLSLDTLLSPAVYIYYDLDLETFTAEGSIGHSLPIADQVSLDMGLYAGWSKVRKGGGDWFYYGASADVVFAVNDNASVKFGARWAGSSEETFGKLADWASGDLDDNSFWWGASVSVGF